MEIKLKRKGNFLPEQLEQMKGGKSVNIAHGVLHIGRLPKPGVLKREAAVGDHLPSAVVIEYMGPLELVIFDPIASNSGRVKPPRKGVGKVRSKSTGPAKFDPTLEKPRKAVKKRWAF